eukprot:PhF_6_TR4339/c0_g1_i3/m.5847
MANSRQKNGRKSTKNVKKPQKLPVGRPRSISDAKIRAATKKLRQKHPKKVVIGPILLARELGANVRTISRILTKKSIPGRILPKKEPIKVHVEEHEEISSQSIASFRPPYVKNNVTSKFLQEFNK